MVMKRPSRLLVGRLLFIVALFATAGRFCFRKCGHCLVKSEANRAG
jgi:hypothetical protein